MKLFIGIVLFLFSEFAYSQDEVPKFKIQNTNFETNSTLGGAYVSSEDRLEVDPQKKLVFVKEVSEGDFILIEINKNDKKDYSLEVIDTNGEVIINISKFNSSSFKIIKNNLGSGNFTVELTEKESNIVDIGTITL